MKYLLILPLFLSGCATVNYTYQGKRCDLIATTPEQALVLVCQTEQSESRTQHDRNIHEHR